jgi:hypothetical protein
MQIYLPDHPKLVSKAVSAGFSTVEEYVRHLVEEDAGPLDLNGDSLSQTDWQRRFDDLLASVESGNPNFDDSRESIYPVR